MPPVMHQCPNCGRPVAVLDGMEPSIADCDHCSGETTSTTPPPSSSDSASAIGGSPAPGEVSGPGSGWKSLVDIPLASLTGEEEDSIPQFMPEQSSSECRESIFSDESNDDEDVFGIGERKTIELPAGDEESKGFTAPPETDRNSASGMSSKTLSVPAVMGFANPPPQAPAADDSAESSVIHDPSPPDMAALPHPPISVGDWTPSSTTLPAVPTVEPPAPEVSVIEPAASSYPESAEPPPLPLNSYGVVAASPPPHADPAPPLIPNEPNAVSSWTTRLLVLYALAVTIAAVLGWVRTRPEGNPLTVIPDIFGEYDPAARKTVSSVLPDPDVEIPAELRVHLGQTLTIGDLSMTPLKIAERKVVQITEYEQGSRSEKKSLPPCLVLTARVTNQSADLSFHPVDPAFNRKAVYQEPAVVGIYPPGNRPFIGGPISWPFNEGVRRVYIEGQEAQQRPLGPGESQEVLICSLASGEVPAAIRKADGTVLWKLQFRRGRVPFGLSTMPVTTLIGVEFQPSEVEWSDRRG